MFCQKCGNPLQPNERFCTKCGAPNTQQPQGGFQQPQAGFQQRPVQPNFGMNTAPALPLPQFIVQIVLTAMYVLLIPFWFIHGFSTGFGWYGMSNVIATFYTIITIIGLVCAATASILPIFKINLDFNKNFMIQKVVSVWLALCFFLVTFNGTTLTVWGVFFIIFLIATAACFVVMGLLNSKKLNGSTFKNLTR